MSLLGKYLASLDEVEEFDVLEESYCELGHNIILGPSCEPDPVDALIDADDSVDNDDPANDGKNVYLVDFLICSF